MKKVVFFKYLGIAAGLGLAANSVFAQGKPNPDLYPSGVVLPQDHHVEIRFKAFQEDPIQHLRKKLWAQQANFAFPFSDLYPDTVVWGTTCFRYSKEKMFMQTYGEPLHYIFKSDESRKESRDKTFQNMKVMAESLFSTDDSGEGETQVLKVLMTNEAAEGGVFDECKKIWKLRWPRMF